MRKVIIAAALAVGVASDGWAMDEKGTYTARGWIGCGEYLDAYSKSTLEGKGGYTGPSAMWEAAGHINGIITGANAFWRNGKKDNIAGMTIHDVYRWVASWCRDNPSQEVHRGVIALINSRQ